MFFLYFLCGSEKLICQTWLYHTSHRPLMSFLTQMVVFDLKSVGVMICIGSIMKNYSVAMTPIAPLTALSLLSTRHKSKFTLWSVWGDAIHNEFSHWTICFHFIVFFCVSVSVAVPLLENNCREYAETVGRKVRDLGMVVDLIFLNTEVSLTQALEDVGRARTPFAIIITQQHQVHRSCTVNILFGTPQGNVIGPYTLI